MQPFQVLVIVFPLTFSFQIQKGKPSHTKFLSISSGKPHSTNPFETSKSVTILTSQSEFGINMCCSEKPFNKKRKKPLTLDFVQIIEFFSIYLKG